MFPDGTFVGDANSTAIYLVQGGALRLITNGQVYQQIGGPASVPKYPFYQLAQLPQGAYITSPSDVFQPATTPPRPPAPTLGVSSSPSPLGTSVSPARLPLPVLVGGAVLLYVLLMRRR